MALITEKGRIMMAEDSSWDDFTSRQISSVDPPRLVWAAEAEWAPLLPVMTLTAYTGDKGFVRSYFWGLVEGFENQGLVIKAYLMQRWLGEAVWYPDALLPSARLRWEKADTKVKGVKVARVILEDDGIKVSGQFFFGRRRRAHCFSWATNCPSAIWRASAGIASTFRLAQARRQADSL